jgi:flagellar biosynthetic protein FliR
MEISIANLIGPVLLVGLRVSGLMLFAPFFSSAVIPPRMKIALVITITAVLYPVYSAHLPAFSVSQWPVIVGSEMLVGIAMGLATNAVIEGAQLAGQILSIQMGYSLVNILDPNTQVENTVVALFHQGVALLIFVVLGVHHWIIRAIAHSFEYLPPGTATLSPVLSQALLHEGAIVLELGARAGSHATGGLGTRLTRQSLTANAADAAGAGNQEHAGRTFARSDHRLLAAVV